MFRKLRKLFVFFVCCFIVLAACAFAWAKYQLAPTEPGKKQWIRFATRQRIGQVLKRLRENGIIKNDFILMQYARWKNAQRIVDSGTYSLSPGMTADEVLQALRDPIKQMVRLPEGWWIARTADLLAAKNICTHVDYLADSMKASEFSSSIDFPLSKRPSLEGYLLPDTYDLPPLIGSRAVITRQLMAFSAKVIPKLPTGADLDKCVIIGSMIEAEVAKADERPIVSSVIANRLAKGMPLQIDATVLYAIQEWKQLGPGEVKKVLSPYNTYLHKGLPPGPICSPSVASIIAAANPAKTNYLYYVAKPDGSHYFSSDYATHLRNIKKARAEAAKR